MITANETKSSFQFVNTLINRVIMILYAITLRYVLEKRSFYKHK